MLEDIILLCKSAVVVYGTGMTSMLIFAQFPGQMAAEPRTSIAYQSHTEVDDRYIALFVEVHHLSYGTHFIYLACYSTLQVFYLNKF